ncbi:MAG: hypothetical protein WC700_04240 [Gemmatimonadaceae bacterium]|jgi:hypothetical protein
MREVQNQMLREDLAEEERRKRATAAPRAAPRRPEGFSPGGPSGHHGGHHAAPPLSDAANRRSERGVDLDVHELLKREAFAAQQGSCDDHFEKNRACPSGIYGISDQFMVLDSFNKLRESRVAEGEFQWNFMVQGVTGDQVIGVRDKIDTVIEVQMGPFTLPILEDVPYELVAAPAVSPSGTNRLVLIHNNANGASGPPTLIPNAGGYGQYPEGVLLPPATTQTPWVNNPYTQLPNGNRLTVQIREAGLQSFSDRNGARHHFEFTTRYAERIGHNPTMLQMVPVSGDWERYIFTDPLKDVHGVTLVFRNPDIPVKFLPDCLYEVTVVSDAAAAPGPFLRFDSTAHGLHMGDRIFVSGFRSGIAVLDTFVNRPQGLVVAGNPAVAPLPPGTPLASAGEPNRFWTDPAISIVDFAPAPTLPQVVTVCIAKRRLLIPMRLRRVVDRLTQYIAP